VKVDLDKLEVTAKAAEPGPWWLSEQDGLVCSGPDGTDAMEVGAVDFGSRNLAYLLDASPDVTLALIGRIRELEAGLQEAADIVISWDEDGVHGPAYLRLVNKGTTR
jgi:hypothetical protein